jgi:uncharacterized protein YdbL (DUF1318 family)
MTRNHFLKVVLMAATLLAFQSAWALDIQSAKAQGLIGEESTGLVAARGTPSAEVRALVTSVNDKREAEFERTSKKTGATVAQVKARFYELAVQRTKPGHYYQDESGNWVSK